MRTTALLIALGLLAGTACSSGDGDRPAVLVATLTAVVADDAPFTVVGEGHALLDLNAPDAVGTLRLVVAPRMDRAPFGVVIDDVRWVHATLPGAGGFAAMAGHGCGPDVDPDLGVVFACTEEYRLLEALPGQPLVEEVRVHGRVGDHIASPGGYRFEQTLRWRTREDPAAGEWPDHEPQGESVVVLQLSLAPLER